MVDRWRDPWMRNVSVAIGAAMTLIASFFAATWLLDRTPPQSVEAAEGDAAPALPAPTPSSGPIVVHGTGDVLFTSGEADAWSGVADLFRSDDVTVINLECAPSELGSPEKKEFTFRCPHGFDVMMDAGVEVVNQGNNHSADFGKEALLDGRRRLTEAGLHVVGSGREADEANAPAILERRGRKVAVVGFGGVVETPQWIATPSRPGVADGYDTASMVRAVRAAAAVADHVVVTLHWGAELDTQPRADDIQRATAMIDAGADAIFGHHAHRLQPLHFYKDRPIFYGLGNFVWPRGGPTAVARVIFEPDGTVRACLVPAHITGGRPSLTAEPPC